MKVTSIKPTISYREFEKVDIRVGTIERVEDIEGSNKLVKLIVEFVDHKRNILAGIKQERENPSEIEGKQALFVINLSQILPKVVFHRNAHAKMTEYKAYPEKAPHVGR